MQVKKTFAQLKDLLILFSALPIKTENKRSDENAFEVIESTERFAFQNNFWRNFYKERKFKKYINKI